MIYALLGVGMWIAFSLLLALLIARGRQREQRLRNRTIVLPPSARIVVDRSDARVVARRH